MQKINQRYNIFGDFIKIKTSQNEKANQKTPPEQKTISNLQSSEMNKLIGGSREYCTLSCHGCNNTYRGQCDGGT